MSHRRGPEVDRHFMKSPFVLDFTPYNLPVHIQIMRLPESGLVLKSSQPLNEKYILVFLLALICSTVISLYLTSLSTELKS